MKNQSLQKNKFAAVTAFALTLVMALPSFASARQEYSQDYIQRNTSYLQSLAIEVCPKAQVLCEFTNLTIEQGAKLFSTWEKERNMQNYLDQVADSLRDKRRAGGMPKTEAELEAYTELVIVELNIRATVMIL